MQKQNIDMRLTWRRGSIGEIREANCQLSPPYTLTKTHFLCSTIQSYPHPKNRMSHNETVTVGDILDSTFRAWENVQNEDALREELLGFHQTLTFFSNTRDAIPELDEYLSVCYKPLKLLGQEDWESDNVREHIPFTTSMLQTCRMALLIEFFWNAL